jgi:hypothetical protein
MKNTFIWRLDYMRARTPQNTGTLKNIGKFPSLKNKSTVWFESHLERDFIYLIEFDKSVTKYQEQPFKVKYFLDGKQLHRWKFHFIRHHGRFHRKSVLNAFQHRWKFHRVPVPASLNDFLLLNAFQHRWKFHSFFSKFGKMSDKFC